MASPDRLVETHGVSAVLTRASEVAYSDWDDYDETASTETTEAIKVYLSQPSESDERLLAGRRRSARFRATVKSTLDISANREGREDRVQIDGEDYKVVDVQDDVHPLTGLKKKRVLLQDAFQGTG